MLIRLGGWGEEMGPVFFCVFFGYCYVFFFWVEGNAILRMREMGICDPRLCNFDGEGIEKRWTQQHTSIIGFLPLMPTFRLFLSNSTIKSRALSAPSIGMVISTSPSVCVHLYGRRACSSFSLARRASSAERRSEAVSSAGAEEEDEDISGVF